MCIFNYDIDDLDQIVKPALTTLSFNLCGIGAQLVAHSADSSYLFRTYKHQLGVDHQKIV